MNAHENSFLPANCESPSGLSLQEATKIGQHILAAIEPLCMPGYAQLCGSVRRRRDVVNDVDFACIPKDLAALRARVLQRCTLATKSDGSLLADGATKLSVNMATGVQLDFFFAHEDQRDLLSFTPTNWGMIFLAFTGSKNHNIYLASEAGRRGLHFSPAEGIKKDGKIIASETELAIFRALDLPFIEPERRER